MKIYEINCEKYFNGYLLVKAFVNDVNKVELPMQQLITHFEIKNKEVLSIGPGRGHEEYWFYKNGCELTFVDIDENKNIEPYLKNLNKEEKNINGPKLTYILGDAQKLIESFKKKYDICYFSSFTPDEIYRRDIQDEYRKPLKEMIFILV